MVVAATLFLRRNQTSPLENTGATSAESGSSRPLQIGFGLAASTIDFGWSYRQNEGRLGLEAQLLDAVDTWLWEGISDPNMLEQTLPRMVAAKSDLVFLLTDLHPDRVTAFAQQNPAIKIVQLGVTPHPPNLGAGFIHDHETAFLSGVVAARTPGSGQRFAVLAPFDTPVIRWVANAFTLGARSVREEIGVEFRVLETWYDPTRERAAVNSMAADGVGAVYLINIAPVQAVLAAEEAGVFVLSHFGNTSSFAPTRWLTGTARNWHRFFADVTRRVQEGTWEPITYSGGLREGYLQLAQFGPEVTPETIAEVRELTRSLVAGERAVFQGPIRDREGQVRIPEGESSSWTELVNQAWMVEGIVSTNESAALPTSSHPGNSHPE